MRKNDRKQPKRQPIGRASGAVSQVKLALGTLIRETFYETVLMSGIETVMEVLEQERAELCGPRYQHAEQRAAYRSGHVPSALVLGGRRVSVNRPRVRTTAGAEVVLPSWAAWSREDPLEERAVEQMLVGVSTRKYDRSLETLPKAIASRGTAKSAVSRAVRARDREEGDGAARA